MSVHDPLCPDYPHARRVVCQCDLIARVRAEYNEREAVAEALADLRAKVEALRSGPGWYGFIKRPEATTHVAYVHENGEVWVPDMGWTTAGEFALLTEGKEERLIGVDAVLALLPEEASDG